MIDGKINDFSGEINKELPFTKQTQKAHFLNYTGLLYTERRLIGPGKGFSSSLWLGICCHLMAEI